MLGASPGRIVEAVRTSGRAVVHDAISFRRDKRLGFPMKAHRNPGVVVAVAAACLALPLDARAAGGETGLALRLRCWLAPSIPICRDLARERENRALEAVEAELRGLGRRPPPIGPDRDLETTRPSPP